MIQLPRYTISCLILSPGVRGQSKLKPWFPERGWALGQDRPVSGVLPSSATCPPSDLLPVPDHHASVHLTAFVVAPLPARVVMVTVVYQVLDSSHKLLAHRLCPPPPEGGAALVNLLSLR